MVRCRCPHLSVQYGDLRLDQIHQVPALCQLDDSHHGLGVDVLSSNPSAVVGASCQVCEVIVRGRLSFPCACWPVFTNSGCHSALLYSCFACLFQRTSCGKYRGRGLPAERKVEVLWGAVKSSCMRIEANVFVGLCCCPRSAWLALGLAFGANCVS